MKINFDTQIERRNTNCSKWDRQGGDYLPLWVADMDFAVAEPILDAIKARLKHPVFGYTYPGESLYRSVISYYREHYDFDLPKEWIVFNHGVNLGNNIAARALGGAIMVTTPMYPHINQRLPEEAGKEIIRVPLKETGRSFTFDFEALERAVTDQVTTFVLCNPHNPVGRVYNRQELTQLFDFAKRHGIVVLSDEIHSDLILEGQHIPAFMVSEEARKRVIVHHSASKTYNLPGLPLAFAVIPDPDLRRRYEQVAATMSSPFNVLALTAFEAAFTSGEPWRQALLAYLRENKHYLDERAAQIEGIYIYPSQGTYLAWMDVRQTGIQNPWKFFREKAGVNFNDGVPFSADGFVRVNFGCPRENLKIAFDRVELALGSSL